MDSLMGPETEVVPTDPGRSEVRFDFRNRADLSKDHIRRVEIAHEAFARRMGREVSSLLRVKAEFDLASAQQVTVGEYLRALPNPAVVALVELPPLPGNLWLEITPETAFRLIDAMLGGRGRGTQSRRPTEIETSLLGQFVERALDPLSVTFEPLIDVDPAPAGFEFNPLLIPSADPGDGALLLEYAISVDGHSLGSMTLCYPLSLLQPIGEILHWEEPETGTVTDAPGPLVDVLPGVELPVSVRLNPITMPAVELLDLEPGDVIRLSHRVDEPVVGIVDDRAFAEGRIGRSGQRVAFEFISWRDV